MNALHARTATSVWTLLAVLVLTASASSTARGAEVHQGSPPIELWGLEKRPQVLVIGEYLGTVEYHTADESLSIRWRASSDSPAFALGSQQIPLSYWPTAVVRTSPSQICVAGKRAGGATVIEEFSFGPPIFGPDGFGNNAVAPRVVTKVYDAASAGRDMVAFMFADLSDEDRLFVQFWDSRDVYRLDRRSGALELAYARAPGARAPHARELGLHLGRAFFGNHVDLGFLYGLRLSCSEGSGVLLLIDGNRDGTLDTHLHLTSAQWAAMDLSNAAHYVE